MGNQWRNWGARGDICPRALRFWGAKLRSEFYVIFTANIYDLQNVECQQLPCAIQLRNLIKITKVRKGSSYEL